MSSKSSYFLYTSLLVLVIFPFSLAHATYPSNITVTAGSCSAGTVSLSWGPPDETTYLITWISYEPHDFSASNTFSKTYNLSDPLPPGSYYIDTSGYDSGYNGLWYGTSLGSTHVSAGDTVTSVTQSGTISGNDGGNDYVDSFLFTDPSNVNMLAYAIADNGTILATTTGTSYTVTGLSTTTSHYIQVGTIVANQTNGIWYSDAIECPLPDVIAGGNNEFAPYPILTGQSESFSNDVQNWGDAVATNFPNIFQIVDSTMTNTIARVDAGTISSLDGEGASTPLSGSYTFTTPGTYYVRTCANMNTSGATVITESDSDNNCNNWSPLTVTSPPPACSTLTATPSTIDTGGTVHLTWLCQNVSSCAAISNTDGFTTNGHTSGSGSAVPSTPNDALTYGMTCDGTNFYFPPVAVVTPTVNISANPARVRQSGATTTVSWNSSNVDPSSCSVKQNGATLSSGLNNGSTIATINSQTTFSISCSASGPTVTSSAAVNIAPGFLEF